MITHQNVLYLIEAGLVGEPGWTRPENHRFRHEAADVSILVLSRDVLVIFDGNQRGSLDAKVIGCRIAYRPTAAVATVLDVAKALVAVRTGPPAGTEGSHRAAR